MVPSYDYNRDTSPREDEDNSRDYETSSDSSVNQSENSNLGIGNTYEEDSTANKELGTAGKIAVVGLYVVGKILGKLS